MSQPTVKIGGVTVPANLKGGDLLKFLVENKALLMQEKKAATKEADAYSIHVDLTGKYVVDKDGRIQKAAAAPTQSEGESVLCVINTTGIMDSHSDVHIPGLWKKSLSDNEYFLHLQEHEMKFTHIISSKAKGYTQKMTWKELGFDAPGTTEALIFQTPLTGRCPYMEDQYRKGHVENHSVGMRYVVIKLCINEPDNEYYKEEYANWVQYAPMVVNLDAAEAQGFFWAVLEAKIVEGSAVPAGSNRITPHLGFKSVQPPAGTEPIQPEESTGGEEEKPKGVDIDKLANLNFFN
jgi:hypothetical protein